MRKGTASAKQALVWASLLLVGAALVVNVQSIRDDPTTLLLILLFIGIAYCVKLLQLQPQWRLARPAITSEGVLAPTRSFAAAWRAQPGRLIRFEDVGRVIIRGAKASDGHRLLVLQTKNGWVYNFHEQAAPEVFAA